MVDDAKNEAPSAPVEVQEVAKPSVGQSTPAPGKTPVAVPLKKKGKGGRPRQCSQCSKNLKKKTWYYRDNKYFCNKRCWKASKTPKAKSE